MATHRLPRPRPCPLPRPWDGHDRGEIDSNGVVTRKCSTDFLATLYTTYVDLVEQDDTKRTEFTTDRLSESITAEIWRLMQYRSLFPSDSARKRFFNLLTHLLSRYDKKRDKLESQMAKKELLAQANTLVQSEDQRLEALNRPTFKPELLPWEQFLLKGSPGSGIQIPPTSPNTIVQVMPIGGVALHLRWLRNTYLTAKKCRESTSGPRGHPERQPIESVAAGRLPSSGLEYSTSWIEVTPNIYFERRFPMIKDSKITDKLESFNSVIGALENERFIDYSTDPAGIRAMFYRSVKKNQEVEQGEEN